MDLRGRKVIAIGERDGVQGPSIALCVKSAGAEVVYTITQCFVWTAAGAMDLETQDGIKKVVEDHGAENLVVVLGAPDPDSTEMYATTVTKGDPTYAGPLAGVQLGLPVYHILEPEIKELVDPSVYQEQVGIMEMVLDTDKIISSVNKARDSHPM